jgi:hypothetical protein
MSLIRLATTITLIWMLLTGCQEQQQVAQTKALSANIAHESLEFENPPVPEVSAVHLEDIDCSQAYQHTAQQEALLQTIRHVSYYFHQIKREIPMLYCVLQNNFERQQFMSLAHFYAGTIYEYHVTADHTIKQFSTNIKSKRSAPNVMNIDLDQMTWHYQQAFEYARNELERLGYQHPHLENERWILNQSQLHIASNYLWYISNGDEADIDDNLAHCLQALEQLIATTQDEGHKRNAIILQRTAKTRYNARLQSSTDIW